MNKSFKVVFSKARGALMVVNELTSSVQAKGTKTVIAAAVATMVAGAAGAAEPAGKTTLVVDSADKVTAVEAATEFVGYTSQAFKPDGVNDYKSGAVYIMGQTVKFKDNVKFEGNKSSGTAGALEIQGSTATLKDATFTNNTAESWGGCHSYGRPFRFDA